MFCIEDNADYKKGIADIRKEIGTILGTNLVCKGHAVFINLLALLLKKVANAAEVPEPIIIPKSAKIIALVSNNVNTAPVASEGQRSKSLSDVPSHTTSSPPPADERLEPRQGDWNYLYCIPFALQGKVLSAYHDRIKEIWDIVKLTSHIQLDDHDLYELMHFMDHNTLKVIYQKVKRASCTPTPSQIESEYQTYDYGIIVTFLEKIKI
jgi:hypothetical protein